MCKDSSVEYPRRKLTAIPPSPFCTATFSLPGGCDSSLQSPERHQCTTALFHTGAGMQNVASLLHAD